jgi:nifR3 family TIM-barrel protein
MELTLTETTLVPPGPCPGTAGLSVPSPRPPVYLGPVRLPSRYFLAPLAGYTNLALRRTVRELGGLGLATTDLVNARSLVERSRKSDELIATSPDDRPTAVQIFGSEPQYLAEAARVLVARGYGHVDINMGCPVQKVTKNGGGSAMMCDTTGRTVDLVRSVVEAVPVPVTVKMRLGWDDRQLTAPWFAREFERAGVAAVTIHGRTREQGFGGTVNLDGIARVVEAVEKIPIVGNGDIRTLADAARMFAVTGCHAIALGRGALLNPWIFKQLQLWEETGDPGPPPTYHERLRFMETHVRRLCELRGERWGCIQFRKVSNWYCKVLKPGREVQQTLVMLDTLATFERVVTRLRGQGPPPGWQAGAAPNIPMPKGPIDKW